MIMDNKEGPNNIAFVIRRIPHYRVPFYRSLIEKNKHLNITIYYGTTEDISGGSGLISSKNYSFAKKLRSFKIGSYLFQIGLIKNGIIKKYQLVIFEGSASILSNYFILFVRKLIGKKNLLWLKGWPNEIGHPSKSKYLMKKMFLSLADAFVVYGNESKKSLRRYNIDESAITIAQNTIDVQDIISKKDVHAYETIKSEKLRELLTLRIPYIYNIGRIISAKRVDDLIEAFKIISFEIKDAIQLIVAGDGPNLNELKEKAHHLNLSNIHFLGQISEVESRILYLHCLFCVFPGSVGLSLNEAMAAGKPVICADEQGPDSELLVSKYNGLRYKMGNIQELTECMKLLINNPDLRDNLGKRAFETISQKATLQNMVHMFSLSVNRLLQQIAPE